MNLTERLLVAAIVVGRGAKRIFEIGTFNGGTTRMLADLVGPDGEIVTVDLPDDAFAATQRPGNFCAADIGRAFRGTTAETRIRQLRVNSLAFDPSGYEATFDIVLVDGAHDYVHGFHDTETALRLVKPGGLVMWDDFEPYWASLIHGVVDAMGSRSLGLLQGSALGVYVASDCEPQRPTTPKPHRSAIDRAYG